MDRKSLRSRIDAMFETGLKNSRVNTDTLIKIVDGIEAYIEDRLESRLKERETDLAPLPKTTAQILEERLPENWEVVTNLCEENSTFVITPHDEYLIESLLKWLDPQNSPTEIFSLYKKKKVIGKDEDFEIVNVVKIPGQEPRTEFTLDEIIEMITPYNFSRTLTQR